MLDNVLHLTIVPTLAPPLSGWSPHPALSRTEDHQEKEKMVYIGFMKLISMVVYPFPIHVVFKGFGVGRDSTGGCALFKPFGFREISNFQAKKSSGSFFEPAGCVNE
ncbi:hypothetical protein RHMOL_Rhmol04G0335900 [Rhododendron molle]|uniref:Uncharacterized protein n=1 Tax=Rhododendron molle TaxID=49168 RepID=A0ACC0P702_RHOML|nr:hypothetical protein RHMOL_Rhmol04G0335900 [Rhododendron molle]